MNENQFTWRSGQNYTLNYYHLTFSETNRLIVSVICAWLSIKNNYNNHKIVKNTSSMKQNNWTASCTQNEAESARETLIAIGKCDWKRDRKCSTWRMRKPFCRGVRFINVWLTVLAVLRVCRQQGCSANVLLLFWVNNQGKRHFA